MSILPLFCSLVKGKMEFYAYKQKSGVLLRFSYVIDLKRILIRRFRHALSQSVQFPCLGEGLSARACHKLDDLFVGFLHALVAECRDVVDCTLDAAADKSVACVKFAILAIHIVAHNACIDCH